MSILNHSDIQWRKSSCSSAQGGECVEIAGFNGQIAVRDSKNPDGPVLTFDTAVFGTFLNRVRQDGEV